MKAILAPVFSLRFGSASLSRQRPT
jgi:hypothetical protein